MPACLFRAPAGFRPVRRLAPKHGPPRQSHRRADACRAIDAGSDAGRGLNSPIQPESKSWPRESATRPASSKFKVGCPEADVEGTAHLDYARKRGIAMRK